MQDHSSTEGSSLSDFLRALLQRNLDRVLMANQPGELRACPTEDSGGTGGDVMCGVSDELPIGVGDEWEALVLSCSESVKAMAWKFARSSSCVDVDDMYSIGMLAVCEAALHLAEGANPFPYFRTVARYAMIDEWRRLHGHSWSTVSLDAPLSDDSSLSLADIVPSPALAAPTSSKRSQALHGAMRRLASTRQRAVLRRRYGLPGYGAHSMKEAARSLHTSLGVVDNADRRGLRNLRADVRLREVVGV